jgi:hypothetical protein
MFYITDYITKMSSNTYETLSLMSHAVAQTPRETSDHLSSAKLLLHKCLTQFTCQQQIHAQQAARYLRGFTDAVSSHKTVPMLSAHLMAFVKETYNLETTTNAFHVSSDSDSNNPKGDAEHAPLRITTDPYGKLIDTTQAQDYWFRPTDLAMLSFYDFCHFVRVKRKSKSNQTKNSHDTRLGVLQRFDFCPEHPLYATHHLVEHTNTSIGHGHRELVPRVMGTNIPRESSPEWFLFSLIHFKPFGLTNPLLERDDTVEDVFHSHEFANVALKVMNNWNAVHEYEDERDAEHLKKHSATTKASKVLANMFLPNNTEDEEICMLGIGGTKPELEFQMWNIISLLQESSWFTLKHEISPQNNKLDQPAAIANLTCTSVLDNITFTPDIASDWKKNIKLEEKAIANKCHNALNPDSQNVDKCQTDNTGETLIYSHADINYSGRIIHGETVSTISMPTVATATQDELLNRIENDFSLNQRQAHAFRIISKHYVKRYIDKIPSEKPLRMLLTGPGGTGKTHVVKALKQVMSFYNCGHCIHFLAPTGSAASNIDGMTVHKGLGIKIAKKDGCGKGNREIGNSTDETTLLVSIQNKAQLQDEWKNIDVVLIDEVSLMGAQLLCEIDHTLCFAKEVCNEWFGGITVVFAGDYYQYPPVGGTPLYVPLSVNGRQTSDELLHRLGCLAWKTVDTVVELTEQQRMKGDPEYGAAMQRLHMRQYVLEDAALFNTRVIKGVSNPTGVDMGSPDNISAAAIVSTNCMQEILNARKSHTEGGEHILICASNDIAPSTIEMTKETCEALLKLDFSSSKFQGGLPGFIPLYESMPVVLCLRNISTDLKITNGSQAYVCKVFTGINKWGLTYCKCVIVEFDSQVHLKSLPPSHFPIFPVTFTFPMKLMSIKTGKEEVVRICCHQLPIQPAFAVTGHSAQGKTLSKVIAFLHEGGFAAYVAALRATSRHGLCIVCPVSLDDLNKPLPSDLFLEMKRIDALEHNTQVQYGFSSECVIPVPDTKSNRSLSTLGQIDKDSTTYKIEYCDRLAGTDNKFLPAIKRKSSTLIDGASSTEAVDLDQKLEFEIPAVGFCPRKRRKLESDQTTTTREVPQAHTAVLGAGCQWSPQDWSLLRSATICSLRFYLSVYSYMRFIYSRSL